MTTIRVRVDPSNGDYVIYADPEDPPTPWLGQTADGRYVGWLAGREVSGWPEFELTVPSPLSTDRCRSRFLTLLPGPVGPTDRFC